MKYKLSIGLLLLLSLPLRSANDNFPDQLIGFNNEFGKFVRIYLGCPLNATTAEQCEGSQLIFDTKVWKSVEKKAQPLFCSPK